MGDVYQMRNREEEEEEVAVTRRQCRVVCNKPGACARKSRFEAGEFEACQGCIFLTLA